MTDTKPIEVYVPGPGITTAFKAWMVDEGLNPNDITRLEIHRVDGKYLGRVTEFLQDANGHHFCPLDHDHQADRDSCEAASRTYDTPLTKLPQRGRAS